MENKKILLVGGGGHCRSVLDCLLTLKEYIDIGIVDQAISASPILGVPVIGTDDDLPRLFAEGWRHAAVTVGSVGDTVLRRRLKNILKSIGFSLPSIVDPSAILGRDVTIGEGSFVGKRVVINAGSRVGSCAIINTRALLEHDCSIGDFAHVSPGCTLCGQVSVGDYSHVGAASVVRQQIKIGTDAFIGVGSVVTRDIPDHVKAYGNPCKVVETL